MPAISSYWASIGIKVDPKQIQKVDRMLKLIENKLNRFGKKLDKSFVLKVNNFEVDQKLLRTKIQAALDAVAKTTVLPVMNFAIDQGRLNRQIRNAFTQAGREATVRPAVRAPREPRNRVRSAAGIGGVAGIASRVYGPALALAAGGYGLSALNQRNQQVVAAQLQTQAVTQAYGGTAEQGTQSFNFLREQGNRIGFNYLEAAPDFNVLMSNLLGSGGSVGQAQNIFKGFAEYGRVMKLTPARQKLVFNALSQIAGKNALQAEELTKQLGNSLPGAKSLFAEAWQRQTGGKLSGQAAIAALEQAMKNKQVKGDILNTAAQLASERSQPGLVTASRASQAEQARFQNRITDLTVLASQSGVESGYARLFRTLNDGLSESNDLVKKLAGYFDDATKEFRQLALLPESFNRALEGRDSVVADWLGADKVKDLRKDWQDLKTEITALFNMKEPSWLPNLKATMKELVDLLHAVNTLLGNNVKPTVSYGDIPKIDPFNTGKPYTSPAGIAGAAWNNTLFNFQKAKERSAAINDPNSLYFNDPAGYDAQMKDSMSAAQQQAATTNNANTSVSFNAGSIVINTEAQDAEGIAKSLQPHLDDIIKSYNTNTYNNLLINHPQTE